MSIKKLVFKILVVGERNVGKTALIRRYVDGRFLQDTMATIGVDFSLKTVQLKDSKKDFVLQIWDIAGESRFRAILPSYIMGTEVIVLTFDSTDITSLEKLPDWIEIIDKYSQKKLEYILISTKSDLNLFNKPKLIKNLKEIYPQIKFYLPTSSKTGLNVDEIFKLITNLIAKKYKISP